MPTPKPGRTYRPGMALAVIVSVLTVWTTIVRDDGTGMAYFMIIMAAAVGGFATRFKAEGMARTMFGVALMQATLGIATATAPITAALPDGPVRALIFNGVFTALWLLSGALFRAASRNPKPVASPA